MPKLRVLSAAQLCEILAGTGICEVATIWKSHLRKQTADGGRTVIVPNHSEIRRGTLKSIIEQSGLSRDLFRPR